MEPVSKFQASSIHDSIASSMSSIHSNDDSAYSSYNGSSIMNTDTAHRRAASYSPSYMNAKIPVRKPISAPRNPTSRMSSAPLDYRSPPTPPPPPMARGTLLVAIAASPRPSTIFYIDSMLKQRPYRQIYLLGSTAHEEEMKQLKMNIFALLGRLGREITVRMDLHTTLNEADIYTTVSRSVGTEGEPIGGVLCTPSYSSPNASGLDTMALDQEQLLLACTSSMCFLHSVAKQAIPNFRARGHEHKQPSLLLITAPPDNSPIAAISNAACRTLMTLLVDANAARDLTIDYAENIFVPVVEPEKVANGDVTKPAALDLSAQPPNHQPEDIPAPLESPTQLWALYSEFGAAD